MSPISGRRQARVLIVDNDEEVLFTLQRLLEDHGYDTTIASSGKEARGFIRTESYDIILLDDYMSDLDCCELLGHLRSSNLAVPCLVMQPTSPAPADTDHFCSLGASGVVSKRDERGILLKVRYSLGGTAESISNAEAAGSGGRGG